MSVYRNDKADYLKVALESIYEKQTLKPNEIVIVQDGKLTKELYETLDDFVKGKEAIIKIIKLDKNEGLGNALYIGSQKCTYDYIMRMDADDISDSKRFEIQMKYMEEHNDIDCLGTYIAEFNENVSEDKRVREVPLKQDKIIKMAKHRNPMNHVSVCMKKSALQKSGGYEEIKLLEDYYLWLKMIVAGCKLENISESLVYVRVGNGFNSKRGSKQRIYGWRVLQKYMLKHKLINHMTALINMFYICGFVFMPNFLRKTIYTIFLRK